MRADSSSQDWWMRGENQKLGSTMMSGGNGWLRVFAGTTAVQRPCGGPEAGSRSKFTGRESCVKHAVHKHRIRSSAGGSYWFVSQKGRDS